jgi:hypothetical protein
LLISMPEIARLAGVRRPVVTTWRRRHPDFPPPDAWEGGTPLFDAGPVVEWLVTTGRAERARIEPDLRMHLISRLSSATGGRAALPPRTLVATLTSLVCLRHLDGEPLSSPGLPSWHGLANLRERAAKVDPDDVLLRAEIDGMRADQSWLAGVVDDLVEDAWGCRQAYERILTRTRPGVPELEADSLSPALAALVAGLSGAREHADRDGTVSIADPAAGAGDLLIAVLQGLGEDQAATITGAEPDPFLGRLLRRRLTVTGLAAPELTVQVGEADPAVPLDLDVLVTRLPYQPKEQRGGADPLAGVRRITDAMAPGQTAVVVGPADLLVGSLPAYQAAARTRNALLAEGRVEAVIHLPGGLLPYRPAHQTALWVLRREDPSPWRGRVLLADISDRPLTAEVADALVWDVTTWRRDGHRPDQHLRAYAAQVAVAGLAGPRVPLTSRRPSRMRDLTAPQRAMARVLEVEAALASAGDRPAGQGIRAGLAVREERSAVPRRTVADLVRDEWLVVRPGSRVAAADVTTDGHHPVIGAPELTGGGRIGARTVDRGVLADRYPRVRLTDPGDVIVTMAPRLAVHLDREGFSVVEFPARVLRIRKDVRHRLTPPVLAALLGALPDVGHPTGRAPGAVRAATRLVDLQVPILPPAEVERLTGLLDAADERRRLARRELDLLDDLCLTATTGLVDGTLTMAGAPRSSPDR